LLNAQNELFDRNEKQTELMSDLFSQCTLANYENTVWFDVNGFKLVHYFPHLISESLSNDVLNAFRTLTTLYPPNSPGEREMTSRHHIISNERNHYHQIPKAAYIALLFIINQVINLIHQHFQ